MKPPEPDMWLLKVTPTDPAKPTFFLGEGSLIGRTRAEIERCAKRARTDLADKGIAAVEPVKFANV